MNDTILTANQIILNRTDDSSFRSLWISSDREEAYWISLSSNRQVPERMPVAEIEAGLLSGQYAIAVDSFSGRGSNPSSSAVRRRDEIWNLISEIVIQEPAVYHLHERSRMLREISQRSGIQTSNLYKYLARYWKGGMTPNALLPFFENRGKSGIPLSGKEQRRGRKKSPGAEGKSLTPEDIQHFTDAILTWYMGTEKLTLEKVYKNMQDTWYVTRDENGIPVSLDPDQVPSR